MEILCMFLIGCAIGTLGGLIVGCIRILFFGNSLD